MYGPTWEKRLDIQEKLRNISDDELRLGSKAIYNHALNPSTAPSTQALEELSYINDQSTSNYRKSKMDAYMQYLKKNDHFTYKIYLKEIWSWWNNPMNVWNSDFDFICVGNGFKRKYVA